MTPVPKFCLSLRDADVMLVDQWRQGLVKGGDFIVKPAEVVVDGERHYTHPMTCNWSLKMHARIQQNPDVMALAASCGVSSADLLAFSVFSDKTNVGNLSAYPLQIVPMHASARDIQAAFAGGNGICAYIPVAEKPAGEDAEGHTEHVNELLARCLHKVCVRCTILHWFICSCHTCKIGTHHSNTCAVMRFDLWRGRLMEDSVEL